MAQQRRGTVQASGVFLVLDRLKVLKLNCGVHTARTIGSERWVRATIITPHMRNDQGETRMVWNLLGRFWNRRKNRKRIAINVAVRTADAEGRPCEVTSEDISISGIRLRFNEQSLAAFVGHREEVPLEISLEGEALSIQAQARLVWAYNTSGGGTVSGWHFGHFEGNAGRRLQHFLNTYNAGKTG